MRGSHAPEARPSRQPSRPWGLRTGYDELGGAYLAGDGAVRDPETGCKIMRRLLRALARGEEVRGDTSTLDLGAPGRPSAL